MPPRCISLLKIASPGEVSSQHPSVRRNQKESPGKVGEPQRLFPIWQRGHSRMPLATAEWLAEMSYKPCGMAGRVCSLELVGFGLKTQFYDSLAERLHQPTPLSLACPPTKWAKCLVHKVIVEVSKATVT